MHALGEEKAVIIGHDWGSTVTAHCAVMRPDIFYKVALLLRRNIAGNSPIKKGKNSAIT